MPRLTRREFLYGTGTGLALGALPQPGSARRGWYDEVRVACVGLRGRGKDHLKSLSALAGVRVVALVDVDRQVLDRAVQEFGVPVDAYADVRKVLERADVDAVSIATPNHWHSLQAIWACQAGKDVYVEKPVSHNIHEGSQLVAAARKYRRIVQAGTQCRSSQGIAEGIAWLREGNLGKIQLARGLCYKPRQSIGKVAGDQPLPAHVDYELWTGPAPLKPLHRKSLHYDWHWDFDTGNGDVGNQGIHQMDLARWALGADCLPRRTVSVGGRLGYDDDGNTPNSQIVWHDYEGAPLVFEVRGLPHDLEAQKGDWGKGMDDYLGSRIGVIVHCEGGTLRIPDYTRAIAYDKDGKEIRRFEGACDHFANFIDAVRSRKPADLRAEVQQGHLSSALCHLGNVSHRLGQQCGEAEIGKTLGAFAGAAEAGERLCAHLRKNGVDLDRDRLRLGATLTLDVAKERFVDNAAANRMATREYRAGFELPEQI
jgi:predicted dehydrogenase